MQVQLEIQVLVRSVVRRVKSALAVSELKRGELVSNFEIRIVMQQENKQGIASIDTKRKTKKYTTITT